MFPEVFFTFLFQGRSSERNLWQRREKWKLTAPFYCQNVKPSPPSFPKADAKVGLLGTSAKYIQAFFEGLRELFHNSLIDRYVLKHIFKRERKEEGKGTHYIYTRAHWEYQFTP
jgi:hypothetical protein